MSNVPCTRSEGLLIFMSSVTETSTSALGKQGEMLEATAAPAKGLLNLCSLLTLGVGLMAACRSEEHTSELQSRRDLVCRLLLEKKKKLYASIRTSIDIHTMRCLLHIRSI